MTTVKAAAYTWTRKTYTAHANLICTLTEDGKWYTITVDDLVAALGDMYAIDNPRFDRERFNKACMDNVQEASSIQYERGDCLLIDNNGQIVAVSGNTSFDDGDSVPDALGHPHIIVEVLESSLGEGCNVTDSNYN